ncbi:pentatricopeptide repeat-containing protein [Citrus sinensis]|uniref:pentatricopeptide repeat-containing protein At2g45350, chloroplastic n=1 Tax=Citrus sinensis TaxID=2711 RepID=UPI00219A80AE|nr:pentatricopeptide repeat-containing protein At2g45350, chloroplastic [Citrus sinensis]KAH9733092.1 pentatricopeptide repeat-containing protein [Citrus sinensis]
MFVSANYNQPCNSTQSTLLLLRKCKTLNDVNQIHARMITTGFIKNTHLTTKLVASFSSSPCTPLTEFARYIFFKYHAFREKKDPFLWNAIIKTYSHGLDPKEALVMFCLMLDNGVSVDKFSASLVLKACSRLGLIEEGLQIHGLLRKVAFGSDLFLQNCLISLYVRCGCLEFARQLFDKMGIRDSVSYNSMIDGYVKSGNIESARELFDSMPIRERNLISWNSVLNGYAQLKSGLQFAWQIFEKMPERDLISWNSMLHGCVKCGKMDDAQALFDKMPKRDVVSWANMIDGYAKLGRVDIARRLFDEMPKRDVVACNAMMGGYVRNGYSMKALEIFDNMQCELYLHPDDASLVIVLSAIAQLGHIDKGVAIHRYLEKDQFSLNGKHGVALIDMYSKCGSIENAIKVFEQIEDGSVDHWNAMINGLAIHGLGELAFDLLMEMERLSIEPDDITFTGLLNACAHAGLVKEGLLCFELMRRIHKLEPELQHYGCMVDILGRAGHIEAARNLIEDMPMEPNDVIWRTLLSACRNYENLNVGEPVAKHLIGMDSSNSSSYVLLSNMFAGLGMWNDARRVRSMMKERNLKKLPGCSWIELEGVVHEFFVRDKSRLQVRDIYYMLDNMWTPDSVATSCTHYG